MGRAVLTSLLVAALGAACLHVHVHTGEEPQAGHGLEPGDRVVGRWQDGFYEATVITVQGKLVTVAWDEPPPERSQLSVEQLQRLDARPAAIAEEQWLLCPGDGGWDLCQARSVVDDEVEVLLLGDGTRHRVGRGEVLAVPASLLPWLRQQGALQAALRERTQRFEHAVPVTAGQPVQPGELVVARWRDGGWWGGVVKELHGRSVLVGWSDGSEDETPLVEVAPLRPQPQGLQAGDLAFCTFGGSAQWWPVQIEALDGSALRARHLDDTTGEFAPGDCIAARSTLPE